MMIKNSFRARGAFGLINKPLFSNGQLLKA